VGGSFSSSVVDLRREEVERAIKIKTFLTGGNGVNGLNIKLRSKGKLHNGDLSHTRPHPVFPVPSWSMMANSRDTDNSICDVNTNLWECLGSDRDWGLVSMLDQEGERRMESIPRLLNRTHLLVVSTMRKSNLPTDFKLLNTYWNGRRCFSQTTNVNKNAPEKLSVIIQGDLDTAGETFNAVVSRLKEEGAKQFMTKYKQKKNLLMISSLLTSGDILELGTDKDTTELLHTVVQADNENEMKAAAMRMLVTTDSSSAWLNNHSALLCSFHQFVFVPLYNNGAGCRQQRQSGLARELHDKLRRETAREITCTHMQG